MVNYSWVTYLCTHTYLWSKFLKGWHKDITVPTLLILCNPFCTCKGPTHFVCECHPSLWYFNKMWNRSLHFMSQVIPHTWRFLLMHIITKYDSSSSVRCILFFMNFQMWRSWETQYSSIGTVVDSIPLNVSRSRVSRETQKEATLIHSSIQRELRLRPLLVEICKKLLSLSSSISSFTLSSYGFPSSELTGALSCTDHKAQGMITLNCCKLSIPQYHIVHTMLPAK